MTFLQFKKIARWSGLRAALLGATVCRIYAHKGCGAAEISCPAWRGRQRKKHIYKGNGLKKSS